MKAIDNFYEDQEEPNRSCLLALKSIILEYDEQISSRWYYRLPCFMYQNKIFCYLWIDKKTNFPYIAIGKGIHIDHPKLVHGKRKFTSKFLIDPNQDIPIETIHTIFNMTMKLYK